jgi:hypothetical protein
MKPTIEWLDPAIWALLALSALALLAGADAKRRGLQLAGSLLLICGSLALLATLAVPSLLPARSALVRPGGSSDDPRILSVLLAGIAGLAALVPAWRSLRLPVLGNVGAALPGLALAGLLGAVAYFEGLHLPLGFVGIALGGFVMATAISVALRARRQPGAPAAMLLAFGVGAFVAAGMISLHGARTGALSVAEGAAVDTLGQRLQITRVDAPTPALRVLHVVLYGGRDSLQLRPQLRGAPGRDVLSVADANLFSGPVVVPIQLEERRARAHEIQWVDRTTPLHAGDATIALKGFRFVKGDTIRMYADLDVTTPAGRQAVSPGVFATRQGESPFAAEAAGFGPIAVVRIDADHGRVGLVLPRLSSNDVARIADVDLRLRPALPFAWAGAALALAGFVFGLVSLGGAQRRG